MKLSKYLRVGAALAVASILFMASSSDVYSAIEGRWIHHPAAALRSNFKQSQVDRIFEGNRYVYFSVRGAFFNRSYGNSYTTGNNIDPLQLFRYDKSMPWNDENIKPLASSVELSGTLPVALNYSPEAGVLAVAYDNRNIDFIYDDDRVVKSPVLCDVSMAGVATHPYTISFDEEKGVVYVGGSFGYAVIDYKDGELKDVHSFGVPVSWVNRVGENIVLFAGNISSAVYATSTYIFPENNVPSSLTSPVVGGENLQALMPLSSNSFAAIASYGDDLHGDVKKFTIANDGVRSETIKERMSVDDASTPNLRHMFRTDGFFSPAKDGYYVYGTEGILKIGKGADAGKVTEITREPLSANERAAKAATLDGSRLWLYKYESNGSNSIDSRGFYYYGLSGDKWTGKSALAVPSAPTTMFAQYVDYAPEYGMIFRNIGAAHSTSEVDIDRVFSYKDGKWKDLSYSANNPKYVSAVLPSRGLKIDPINHSWVWGVTPNAGMHRLDLEDYENFLELGSSQRENYEDTYPGYFALFPLMPAWYVITDFAYDFDDDGTMWFDRYFNQRFNTDYEKVKDSYSPLYFLTAKEREQMAKIGTDKSKLPDILGRELRIYGTQGHHSHKLMVLHHPANKNILVGISGHYYQDYQRLFVYDHNGTPENPDDDRCEVVKELTDENGDKIKFLMETGIYEDPQTGNVWYFTTSGPFIINPQEFLKGNQRCRRMKITRKDGMDVNENPFEHLAVFYTVDDHIGRKWMATENGVYCLSADGQELLAHFTTNNSPLPTNDILSVGFNPETQSIFVLSSRGILEFQPEGTLGSVSEGTHLTVWPSVVTQDHRGYVNITGCAGGEEYIVTDSHSSEVVSLGTAEGGALQWDCRDSSGRRVEAGKYNINRRGKSEIHQVIVLE